MEKKTTARSTCHKFLGWTGECGIDPEKLIDRGVHDIRIAGMSVEEHKRGFVMQIRFFDGMEPRNVIGYARRMFTEFDAVLYYKDGKLDVLEC